MASTRWSTITVTVVAMTLLFSSACRHTASIQDLQTQLKDKDFHVRLKAAQAIGERGRSAANAYPDLLAALVQEGESNYQNLPFYVDAMVKIGEDPAAAILQAVKRGGWIHASCLASGLKAIDPEAAGKLVPSLSAMLRDPDENVRQVAAKCVGTLGPLAAGAVPDLIQLLKSADSSSRIAAMRALANMRRDASPAIPDLIIALRDGDPKSRLDALSVLGAIGPDARAAIPVIREAAKSAPGLFPSFVDQAIKSIGEFPPPPVTELLTKLKAGEVKSRGEAFDGLRHYERARALEALSIILSSTSVSQIEDRVAIVEALGVLGWADPGRAVPPLIKALGEQDEQILSAAASALGTIGPESASAVPALMNALRQGNQNVRFLAGFALSQIGRPSVPALVEALKDDSADVRVQATYSLRAMVFPVPISTIPMLRPLLKDADRKVRTQAAIALALMDAGPKETLPILLEALRVDGQPAAAGQSAERQLAMNYASRQQRMDVVLALGRVGGREAVPALVDVVKNGDPVSRSFAMMSLGNIDDPEAKEALKGLK